MEIVDIQIEILTGIMAYNDEVNGFVPNRFYRATKEEVLEFIDGAREVYPKVFSSFVSSYCISKAFEGGIIKENTLDLEDGDKIIGAIKNHDIPPMPYYLELKDFKL